MAAAREDANDKPRTDQVITIVVPEPTRVAPADEVAISLDDIRVDPVIARPIEEVSTTTITIPSVEAVSNAETPADLTIDRLVSSRGRDRPDPPEGGWRRLVYELTFRAVNLGDSPSALARKELEARIAQRLDGPTRFVAVLSRKGGVGKTTVSTLLGMALASIREDRIIAVDANPDRGTLAERIVKTTDATSRDLVDGRETIHAFSDFQRHVSRDETRLDVLASDHDPNLQKEFDSDDYRVVAELARRFYSIMLTDCGTGMVHSVMHATLDRADQLVVVSGGSIDEARLTSETISWLEANGYEELARNAVVALNTATHGTNLVRIEEIEQHFSSRVRDIVRVPYDPMLATGATIRFQSRVQVRRLASLSIARRVVESVWRPCENRME